MTTEPTAIQIIDALGGPSATARLCDVRPQSVSGWKKSNRIPRAQLKFLKLARPDLFPQERPRRRKSD